MYNQYKYISSSSGPKSSALVKRTSQMMLNGQDIIIQVRSGAPDRVNIPCLMHDTRLCQYDVEMTNDLHGTN